jgi:hypothetical protein
VQLPPVQTHGAAHVPLAAPAGMSHEPVQQSAVALQTAPAVAHSGSQTPLVIPGAMAHERPTQQSALIVQLWPAIWHSSGEVHLPPEHQPEQHSTPAEQS